MTDQDSRQLIIDAATVEFAAHGKSRARIDRIARAAEVNKAMLYYYFRSKDNLYREVLRNMLLGIMRLQSEMAAIDLPAGGKLERSSVE